LKYEPDVDVLAPASLRAAAGRLRASSATAAVEFATLT